jgi:hypothetical protein
MLKIAKELFINELEKIAGPTTGNPIGDMLVLSLLSGLAVSAAQHGKGFKEAKKSGATIKNMLRASPLPLGREFKYKPLKKNNSFFETKKTKTPHNIPLYRYQSNTMQEQQALAKTLGLPLGFVYSKLHKKNENK